MTLELAKSRLSTRALQKIRSRKFPKAITIKEGAGQTVSIILDLTALRKYELLTLRHPNRVVVDLFYSKKKQVAVSKRTPAKTKKSAKVSGPPPKKKAKK
ncbi:MAG: hypothetical protein ACE1ZW_01605, partial [Nitrospirales bacterium]